ncbi:hypothetical protein [Actinoplanes aureus]|uniref:Uncharacterized protein n=1 Tax=Actinoplanes aureus TaxID=2792083 RepID=A0A931CJF9_9ACTN|nr:hypothetical protein [Actinoplanes aureus]MBG0568792.1 hypothetical protein [Actinoplanes aureus]
MKANHSTDTNRIDVVNQAVQRARRAAAAAGRACAEQCRSGVFELLRTTLPDAAQLLVDHASGDHITVLAVRDVAGKLLVSRHLQQTPRRPSDHQPHQDHHRR